MEERGLCPDQGTACVSVSTQLAQVSLPVRLKPFARVGAVVTQCCGEPEVTVRPAGCRGGCEISIVQPVCITIPVEYGADVQTGEPVLDCGRAAEPVRSACTAR